MVKTKVNKKQQDNQKTKSFKSKYFDYYDDIKSPSHKVVDW